MTMPQTKIRRVIRLAEAARRAAVAAGVDIDRRRLAGHICAAMLRIGVTPRAAIQEAVRLVSRSSRRVHREHF